MKHNKYLVVIEPADDGSFSAYVPDLPGCVSCADTVEGLKESIQEAIQLHLEGMREDGLPIPSPKATSAVVEVA